MIKRNLLVIGLAVVLSACGFQLRGTGSTEITLKELDLSARDAYGDTVNLLRRVLQGSGVKIYTGAEYKLILVSQPETQRTASYSGSSRSAEYALTTTLNYEIHGFKDRLLLSDHVEVEKIYVHDGNNLIGSDQEANQIRGEMRNELVQKMVVRLQQLTPERLQTLQQRADDVARAEAEALEKAQKVRDETPQQSPLEIPSK